MTVAEQVTWWCPNCKGPNYDAGASACRFCGFDVGAKLPVFAKQISDAEPTLTGEAARDRAIPSC